MAQYHRWTAEDDHILKVEVEKNATNLKTAFERTAKKVGVTPAAVNKHYYKTLQKNKSNKLFLTVSSKKAATNYKVTRKGPKATKYQPEKTKKSKWKRILAILAE